jgi:two-component system response regulator HydG
MDKPRILIVEDDRPHAQVVEEALRRSGYECSVAVSGQEGLKQLEAASFDLVLTDLVMRDTDGLTVLRAAKKANPDVAVVVMTGYPSTETFCEALDEGAFDYLGKPLNLDVLRLKLGRALEVQRLVRDNVDLRRQLDARYGFELILGRSAAMARILATLSQIAPTDATVLITGESGTGKDLAARAIHANSKRRRARFVALNCAALSESILESELFGHEKGAFTGATYTRIGRFEHAHGGTLFLDEIGDMPAPTQIKLLRVIETGEIVRVGSNDPIHVNVRLIAATNRDLEDLIDEGAFRSDLYYRLKVVHVRIPPLRERTEDIPVLADHFLREFAGRHGKPITALAPETLSLFYAYAWPGNVRELRNAIESMVVTAQGTTLAPADVPDYIRSPREGLPSGAALSGVNLEAMEAEKIKEALRRADGNREAAAEALGIAERTLYRKLKKYGIE